MEIEAVVREDSIRNYDYGEHGKSEKISDNWGLEEDGSLNVYDYAANGKKPLEIG